MRERNPRHTTQPYQIQRPVQPPQPCASGGVQEKPLPVPEAKTPDDRRVEATFLDQQGEVHHADSLRLYLKASDMSEMADRLHAQVCGDAPVGGVGPARRDACRLYQEAQELFGAVGRLYEEVSQTHLEASRLAVTVMALHGDANQLILDAERARQSAGVLRSEVIRLDGEVSRLLAEIGRLQVETAPDVSEPEDWLGHRTVKLFLDADQAEAEAGLLRERSAEADRKAERLRADAERLLMTGEHTV